MKFEFYFNDCFDNDECMTANTVFILKRTNETNEVWSKQNDKLNELSEEDLLNLVGQDEVVEKLSEASEVEIDIDEVSIQIDCCEDEVQILFSYNF